MWVNCMRHDVDHSPPNSIEVKNERSCASTWINTI